jgi:uncharacterized protein YndB with AHSA1/START domain
MACPQTSTEERQMTGSTNEGTRILGSLGSAEGKGVVRVQDRVAASIDDVWSALTDPSRLACWWGEVEGELRPGGQYQARVFASGWAGSSRVQAFDPPQRLLTAGAEPGQAEQTTEYTLTADGDHTEVVCEERGMPLEYLAGYGAGIQVHVEDLASYLAGGERCDANARMAELFPAYQALAAKTDRALTERNEP